MVIPAPRTHFLDFSECCMHPIVVIPEFGGVPTVLLGHAYGIAAEDVHPERRLRECEPCMNHKSHKR